MNHDLMFLILSHLAEVESCTSREIAEALGINAKHASVLLSRCFHRELVNREPYRRGRERGFIYTLSEKGAEWMLHKISVKKPELPAHHEPEKKTVVKPIQIVVQQPKPSFTEELRDLAYSCAFINYLNRCRPQTDSSTTWFSLFSSKQIREKDNSSAFFVLNEEKNQKEKLLEDILKENQETFRVLLQYVLLQYVKHVYNEKPRFSNHSKPRLSFKTLRTTTKQSRALALALTMQKIAFQPTKYSTNKEKTNRRVHLPQLLYSTAAYLSYIDRWWNTLPQTPDASSGSIFENVLEDYCPVTNKNAPKNRPEPQKPKFSWSGTVPPEVLRLC